MKIKLLVIFIFSFILSHGQMAINTNGNTAHATAMLDVAGTGKGVLIPRMTAAQRDAIAAPATGLLVYVTDDNLFYYFNGTQWNKLSDAQKINDLIDGKSDNDGTQDYSSVFLGFQAGSNDDQTDNRNVGVGFKALNFNVRGGANTVIGSGVLTLTSYALWNTGIGVASLARAYSSGNTAMGFRSAVMALSVNSVLGVEAHYWTRRGYANTIVGVRAHRISYNFSYGNTGIGVGVLNSYRSTFNTAMGNGIYLAPNNGNSTAVGYASAITASVQIRLGNTTVTSIGGYANWTNLSDKRFKTDIRENVPGMELVMKLRPVTYHLNTDALARWLKTPDSLRLPEAEKIKAKELQIGFIAQEVEKAAQELGFDFHAVDKPKNDNDAYGLRYAEFIPVLVKAIQELQQMIEDIKQQDITQDRTIHQLQDELEELKRKYGL